MIIIQSIQNISEKMIQLIVILWTSFVGLIGMIFGIPLFTTRVRLIGFTKRKGTPIYYTSKNPKSSHLWGYHDTEFIIHEDDDDKNEVVVMTGNRYSLCGQKMPYVIPFLKKIIGDFDINDVKTQTDLREMYAQINALPQRQCHGDVIQELQNNRIDYTLSASSRLLHSHGQLCVNEIYKIIYDYKDPKDIELVDIVVYPSDTIQLCTIIDLAYSSSGTIKLIPYGGGTNVTGCLTVKRRSKNHYYISVDMRRFNRIIKIDYENHLAIIEAGMNGKDIEKQLNAEGFTMGHEPDSYEFSTLGGWISTYASGMKRGKYGNIEDIVLNYRVITPTNYSKIMNFTDDQTIRCSHGFNSTPLFFGSEGNFGFITKATVKIHRLPQVKRYQSVIFKDMDHGVAFLKDIYECELVPASIRLVDNKQYQMSQAFKPEKVTLFDKTKEFFKKIVLHRVLGYHEEKMVAATIVFEGLRESIDYQETIIRKMANHHGGMMGGAENGRAGYLMTSAIAYIRDFVNKYNILAETFETSCPWEHIIPMTDEMQKRIKEIQIEKEMKTLPFLTYRVTQLYNCGVCLYFTLAIHHTGADICELYSYIESELRQIMMKYGTSVSHHHGIGKLKAHLLKGNDNDKFIQMMKKYYDPNDVMGSNNGIFYSS